METKVCHKCKQEKPISEFWRSTREGYRSRCKTCCKEDGREYAKKGYYRKYQRERYKLLKVKAHKKEYQNKPEVRERKNIRVREWRKEPEVTFKNIARQYVAHEIRAGRINREPCALCGAEQAHGHHPDYTQPLLIVWLCPNCHNKVHLSLKYDLQDNNLTPVLSSSLEPKQRIKPPLDWSSRKIKSNNLKGGN